MKYRFPVSALPVIFVRIVAVTPSASRRKLVRRGFLPKIVREFRARSDFGAFGDMADQADRAAYHCDAATNAPI